MLPKTGIQDVVVSPLRYDMDLSTGNIVEDLARWRNSFMDHCRAKGLARRSLAIYGGVLDELVEFSRPHQDRTSIREA